MQQKKLKHNFVAPSVQSKLNKSKTNVSFEGGHLTSLCCATRQLSGETVFCFLEQNPQVQVVNLSSNQIGILMGESFIEQLGGADLLRDKFPEIVSLNISDNPIADMQAMVSEISLLMPNLKDLQISLFQEPDVDLILQTLPKLEILNNIPVD